MNWLRTAIKNHPLVAYFVLAYAFTWIGSLVYVAVIPNGGALPGFLALPGVVIWYYGPCLAALLTVWASEAGGVRRLLGGLRVWRVGWRWYAFIVIYPLAMRLTVAGLNWALGGPAPRFFASEFGGSQIPVGNLLLTLLGLVLLHIFLRGIGEETGWRAFALPRMQARWNTLAASLLLGVLWAGWHIHPANFEAFRSLIGVFVLLNIVAASVIYAWVYNHTQGSLLAAVLFHMTLNVAQWVAPTFDVNGSESVGIAAIQSAVVWCVVAGLLLREGPDLGRGRSAVQRQDR